MRTYYHGYWIEVKCATIGSLGWRADAEAGTKENVASIRLIGQPDYDTELGAQVAAVERVKEAIHDEIRIARLYPSTFRAPPVSFLGYFAANALAA